MTFRSSDIQNLMHINSNMNFSSPMKHLRGGRRSQQQSLIEKSPEIKNEGSIRAIDKSIDMEDGISAHLNNMKDQKLKINSNIAENSKILDLFT